MILVVVLRISSKLVPKTVLNLTSFLLFVLMLSMIYSVVTLIVGSSSSWIRIAILSLSLIRRLVLALILSWS
jgi:hypothetical protein